MLGFWGLAPKIFNFEARKVWQKLRRCKSAIFACIYGISMLKPSAPAGS